jgi:hypothetical protein
MLLRIIESGEKRCRKMKSHIPASFSMPMNGVMICREGGV